MDKKDPAGSPALVPLADHGLNSQSSSEEARRTSGDDHGESYQELNQALQTFNSRTEIPKENKHRIAIVGCGTIGASFVTMHLYRNPDCTLIVYDTRADIKKWLTSRVKDDLDFLGKTEAVQWKKRLEFAGTLQEAVSRVEIVQEQGPENAAYKVETWQLIEKYAHPSTLLWTSTSGIPASVQAQAMQNKSRLVVCHPYNPPLLMPLIEIVPAPDTPFWIVNKSVDYWRYVKKKPILINKEVPGFVANRLAFALLREAVSLVQDGVISVSDLDALVETSMGPRWAVAGPFKSYHAGGGAGGMEAFLQNIGGTIKQCWKDSDAKAIKPDDTAWEGPIARQCAESFKGVDYEQKKVQLRKVLKRSGGQ